MMRAPTSFAVAVRRRDSAILVRERPMSGGGRTGLAKLPFVRGVAALVETIRLGGEALQFSAEQFERDLIAQEEEEAAAAKRRPPPSITAMWTFLLSLAMSVFAMATLDPSSEPGGRPEDADDVQKPRGLNWVSAILPVAFLIALPQIAAAGADRIFHLHLDVQAPAFQALTGLFKLTIVLSFLLLMRRVPDMRRTFQYHGAEHKTISTYEANEALTVENARTKTTLHPRCGTTFLVMVVLLSVLVFTAIGQFLPRIHTGSVIADNVVFFLEKLPFLPVLAGLAFEVQRLFARNCTQGPLRALLWPGFLVQKITTIEPDEAQLEIAMASLRATLFREADATAGTSGDVVFPSYEALVGAGALRAA
ncbi:MAG TPA: DUF1385 domain-containing protein, partial [Polyangiaceae bacterium]